MEDTARCELCCIDILTNQEPGTCSCITCACRSSNAATTSASGDDGASDADATALSASAAASADSRKETLEPALCGEGVGSSGNFSAALLFVRVSCVGTVPVLLGEFGSSCAYAVRGIGILSLPQTGISSSKLGGGSFPSALTSFLACAVAFSSFAILRRVWRFSHRP